MVNNSYNTSFDSHKFLLSVSELRCIAYIVFLNAVLYISTSKGTLAEGA